MDEKSLKELITRESLWDSFVGGIVMGSTGKAVKTGWDGRVVAKDATGPSMTVGGKKYEFLGYDEKGSPVYQDAEVLKEEREAEEIREKSAEEAENQTTQKQAVQENEVEKNKQYGKIASEIKTIGGFSENAAVHIPPLKVMLEDLNFDDIHINSERGHNVSRETAEAWINESKVSVTVWNGQFEKYYGPNGVFMWTEEKIKLERLLHNQSLMSEHEKFWRR